MKIEQVSKAPRFLAGSSTHLDTQPEKLLIMCFKFINRYALKQMKTLTLFIAAVITLSCLAQLLQAEEFKKPLHFAQGKNSAIVSGDVVRGDRDVYLIRVHSGQLMSIGLSSLEDNAAFDLLEPRARGSRKEKDITGGSDITKWKGTLSKTGEYKIIVGGTRGNTSYKLQVTVQ
jgi:hypothetical protein